MTDIFSTDKEYYEEKLTFHRTVGTFLKIITLGCASNKSNVDKYFALYQQCKNESDKYQGLCKENERMASESDPIVINGVRVSKNTFSDISVINAAGYGVDWVILRASILGRDGYRCSESDGYCNGPLQIHHCIPLSKGGTNHEANLKTLCLYHHAAKHKHMRNV